MAQHKLNQKKSKVAAAGVQKKAKKSNKANKAAPKKGSQIVIAPKKRAAVEQAKMNAHVTRVINDRNEEMLRNRADQYTGRTPKEAEKK